jgi:hypothetical protein
MSIERICKAVAARLPLGKAQGTAILAALVAILLAPVVCRGLLQSDDPHSAPTPRTQASANGTTDENSSSTKQKVSTADLGEKQKQIAADSAELLKMATDLKAEVDKTDKDTLSMNVIRKAGAIEKLAHDVKEKMKTTMGMD